MERGRFLRRAFPDMCLPLGIVVDNVKGHDIPIFIGIGRLVNRKENMLVVPDSADAKTSIVPSAIC